MDSLGWDLGNETIVPPCMWGNQYDSFSEANADYSVISGTAELDEALFSSSLELQGIQACETSTDFDGVGQVLEMLAPAFDSINNGLELDLLQGQEVMRLASNSMESGAETTWREALSSQICSIPSIIKPDMMNPSDQFFTNIGHEEDGVLSTIFSRSENIQNLSCSGNVSSGESEDQGYYWMNKGVEHHCSNPFEDSSQRSLRSKPNRKRKIEESCLSSDIIQSSSSTSEGGFQINFKNPFKMKKPRSENHSSSSTIDFRQEIDYEPDTEAMAQAKEMIYRAAALRPVSLCIDESVEKSRRKNVRISSDPQTVAARHRRERISEKLRVLQRLVPGGSKMDTASMLDEAASYLKFLKSQAMQRLPLSCRSFFTHKGQGMMVSMIRSSKSEGFGSDEGF